MNEGTLDSLKEHDAVSKRLMRAGMSRAAAEQKAELFSQSAQALIEVGSAGTTPAFAWFVPGRIEVLGKHTDYAGGRSLTAALERGFCAVAIARDDRSMHVYDVHGHRSVEFSLSPDLTPTPGHWSNYPMTVARRVVRNFGEPRPLRGSSIAFTSDLPPASGMSSSSALIIAIFLLMTDVNELQKHCAYQRNIGNQLELACYAATIENGQNFGELVGDQGVGTFGGSEDHTAILTATAGKLGQYSYCPARKERSIALPDGFVFAIASSGVEAKKTGAAMKKYNRASQAAAAVADVWRNVTDREDMHIAAAISSGQEAADHIRSVLGKSQHAKFTSDELLARFEHFFAENEQIIPSISERLAIGEMAQFGDLVDRSQRLAETLLRNQVPETIFLAKTARELGAHAASAFGAGFGGSVWALIEEARTAEFLDSWANRYRRAFPLLAGDATFFTTAAGPAALPAVKRLS